MNKVTLPPTVSWKKLRSYSYTLLVYGIKNLFQPLVFFQSNGHVQVKTSKGLICSATLKIILQKTLQGMTSKLECFFFFFK